MSGTGNNSRPTSRGRPLPDGPLSLGQMLTKARLQAEAQRERPVNTPVAREASSSNVSAFAALQSRALVAAKQRDVTWTRALGARELPETAHFVVFLAFCRSGFQEGLLALFECGWSAQNNLSSLADAASEKQQWELLDWLERLGARATNPRDTEALRQWQRGAGVRPAPGSLADAMGGAFNTGAPAALPPVATDFFTSPSTSVSQEEQSHANASAPSASHVPAGGQPPAPPPAAGNQPSSVGDPAFSLFDDLDLGDTSTDSSQEKGSEMPSGTQAAPSLALHEQNHTSEQSDSFAFGFAESAPEPATKPQDPTPTLEAEESQEATTESAEISTQAEGELLDFFDTIETPAAPEDAQPAGSPTLTHPDEAQEASDSPHRPFAGSDLDFVLPDESAPPLVAGDLTRAHEEPDSSPQSTDLASKQEGHQPGEQQQDEATTDSSKQYPSFLKGESLQDALDRMFPTTPPAPPASPVVNSTDLASTSEPSSPSPAPAGNQSVQDSPLEPFASPAPVVPAADPFELGKIEHEIEHKIEFHSESALPPRSAQETPATASATQEHNDAPLAVTSAELNEAATSLSGDRLGPHPIETTLSAAAIDSGETEKEENSSPDADVFDFLDGGPASLTPAAAPEEGLTAQDFPASLEGKETLHAQAEVSEEESHEPSVVGDAPNGLQAAPEPHDSESFDSENVSGAREQQESTPEHTHPVPEAHAQAHVEAHVEAAHGHAQSSQEEPDWIDQEIDQLKATPLHVATAEPSPIRAVTDFDALLDELFPNSVLSVETSSSTATPSPTLSLSDTVSKTDPTPESLSVGTPEKTPDDHAAEQVEPLPALSPEVETQEIPPREHINAPGPVAPDAHSASAEPHHAPTQDGDFLSDLFDELLPTDEPPNKH